MGFYVKHSQIIVLCFEGHLVQAFDCEFVKESPEGQNAEGYVKVRWSLYKKDEKKTNAEMGIDNFEVCVTAALLSKSTKTLHRPVRFSGFKSVRILCFCS